MSSNDRLRERLAFRDLIEAYFRETGGCEGIGTREVFERANRALGDTSDLEECDRRLAFLRAVSKLEREHRFEITFDEYEEGVAIVQLRPDGPTTIEQLAEEA